MYWVIFFFRDIALSIYYVYYLRLLVTGSDTIYEIKVSRCKTKPYADCDVLCVKVIISDKFANWQMWQKLRVSNQKLEAIWFAFKSKIFDYFFVLNG
jgi:hypothetical protein